MNGPPYTAISFEEYVNEYVARRNFRCDAIHARGGPRRPKQASLDPNDGEEGTTRASTYSAIYVAWNSMFT